jgi:HNH endonuclease
MRECIYCKKKKPDNEFTLEHVIPQFLGGAQAPDELKTRDVCSTCNNNLGLFVDAAFEKDFLVYNELHESVYAFFDPENPTSLPLKCMGTSDLIPPNMREDEICEAWIGPLGEQVYWIRPKDERLYWYSGGNPRTVKKVTSTAYFMFSERSQKNVLLSWLTFRDAFIGRQVKKVMCTKIKGDDPKTIGFSEPNEIDALRIQYINNECRKNQQRKNNIQMYLRYDLRFMAKLALGISYVLFGQEVGNSGYSEELRKALWFKEGDPKPNIQGAGALFILDNSLKELCGVAYGVTLAIIPYGGGVAVNLNLNRKMNWTVICAKSQDLTNEQTEKLGDGICITLFNSLKKGLKLTLPELINHNLSNLQNPELAAIEKLHIAHGNYFINL